MQNTAIIGIIQNTSNEKHINIISLESVDTKTMIASLKYILCIIMFVYANFRLISDTFVFKILWKVFIESLVTFFIMKMGEIFHLSSILYENQFERINLKSN